LSTSYGESPLDKFEEACDLLGVTSPLRDRHRDLASSDAAKVASLIEEMKRAVGLILGQSPLVVDTCEATASEGVILITG